MTSPAVNNLESPAATRVAWTDTPADYDIAASDPLKGKLYGIQEGRPCRRLIAGVPGTIVYTGLDGTDVTLPAIADVNGFVWDVQALALKDTSTATNVVVQW